MADCVKIDEKIDENNTLGWPAAFWTTCFPQTYRRVNNLECRN